MAYNVTVDEILADRLKPMPDDEAMAFGGLLVDLTIDPWTAGSPADPDDDDQSMRIAPFGDGCLATYHINETTHRVRVTDVVWL